MFVRYGHVIIAVAIYLFVVWLQASIACVCYGAYNVITYKDPITQESYYESD